MSAPSATTSAGVFPRPVREVRSERAQPSLTDRTEPHPGSVGHIVGDAQRNEPTQIVGTTLFEPIEDGWHDHCGHQRKTKTRDEHSEDRSNRKPHPGDRAGHLPTGVEVA